MPKKKEYDHKPLSTSQRIHIEKGLNDGLPFAANARKLDKHPSTIAKEVKKYRTLQPREKDPMKPARCALFKECTLRFLCDKKDCVKMCKSCYDVKLQVSKCSYLCSEYREPQCASISKAPFVCNHCARQRTCNKEKAYYIAQNADQSSQELLVSCRQGINQAPADIAMLDTLISPLLAQGQSLAHIYAFHGHEIPCSRKTLYNYIDQGVFTAKNIDLHRKVRYKCKPRKTGTRVSLAAKEFRIGRTYENFQKFIQENPDIPVVELDTVEGGRDNSTQAFLTIFFRNCSLMLIFVLQEKSQDQVIKVFDYLTEKLGIKVFQELFPVLLTDNGVEFQFPERLECDKNGEIRTKIFYCNPNSSWQKGRIEKNHEYIRYVIPKGQSLDHYKQRDACVLMNHINSEARDSLNGCTPFRLSKMLLNNRLHRLLCLQEIPGDQVHLKPSLLKK